MLQYFFQAIFALVIWDHLIMFSDEVEYVWKKEKTWRESRSISSHDGILTITQYFGFISWFAPVKLSALIGY